MARPRKITDEQLLAAAGAAIAQLGPRFTLADVAARAGVSAGSVVHRFGSKHGLLVALFDAAIEAARSPTAAGEAADPVAAIRNETVNQAAPLDDPEAAANNLAQLGADLADETLRTRLAELHAAVEARLESLLIRAVDTGELPGAPPAPVAARVLAALVNGTTLRWSAAPVGGLRARLLADLDAVLAGWARPETSA
ncbi:TetR/AcrR family transcriptional regulator [Amycolatopsis taiwanensis]|uniref:TetR/AcrR family transcriptional regulator n=1 Tax=Amycolatopsis taiwanensis TaxID=342230 RepID=UPI002552C2D6|nr:TetR/AcrR family transcriptional regulator [Amycolatopsis taiwanensis]